MREQFILPVTAFIFLLVAFLGACDRTDEATQKITVALVDTPANLELYDPGSKLALEVTPNVKIGKFRPSFAYSAEAVASFLLHHFKISKFGIIFDIEDSFSADAASAAHHHYSIMGGSSAKALPYKGEGMLNDRLEEMANFNLGLIFLASRRSAMYKCAHQLRGLRFCWRITFSLCP